MPSPKLWVADITFHIPLRDGESTTFTEEFFGDEHEANEHFEKCAEDRARAMIAITPAREATDEEYREHYQERRLKETIEQLAEVALSSVDYVGRANYTHRIAEAKWCIHFFVEHQRAPSEEEFSEHVKYHDDLA